MDYGLVKKCHNNGRYKSLLTLTLFIIMKLPPEMMQQRGVDLSQTSPLVCKCGNHTFEQVFFLRVVPALLTGESKPGLAPLMTFACNSCGAVPDQAIPPVIADEVANKTIIDKPKFTIV